MNHPRALLIALDTRDRHSGQPEQQRRTLLHGPSFSIMQ
jgi:hypothetical protein